MNGDSYERPRKNLEVCQSHRDQTGCIALHTAGLKTGDLAGSVSGFKRLESVRGFPESASFQLVLGLSGLSSASSSLDCLC